MATSPELLCRYTPAPFRQVWREGRGGRVMDMHAARLHLRAPCYVCTSIIVQACVHAPARWSHTPSPTSAGASSFFLAKQGAGIPSVITATPPRARSLLLPLPLPLSFSPSSSFSSTSRPPPHFSCALAPQFTEAVVNLKFDEEPKYAAMMALFEPLCGPHPERPIITESMEARVGGHWLLAPLTSSISSPSVLHCPWKGQLAGIFARPALPAQLASKRRASQPRVDNLHTWRLQPQLPLGLR